MTTREAPATACGPAAVIFTERLRGFMTAACGDASQLPPELLGEGIPAAPGQIRPPGTGDSSRTYPVQVSDLVIRVVLDGRTSMGGLRGQVLGGTIAAPALHRESLPIRTGTVELLARTPGGGGCMRYLVNFGNTDVEGAQYVLHGVKRLAAGRSVSPRRIWRETTTLLCGIYRMPENELVLTGPISVHARDFARQLRSLSADPASDPDEAAVAVARFLGIFAAAASGIYVRRATSTRA